MNYNNNLYRHFLKTFIKTLIKKIKKKYFVLTIKDTIQKTFSQNRRANCFIA